MPGILDLIVEKNKTEKRLEEIDTTLRNEYSDLFARAINGAWARYFDGATPESNYIQSYDIVDGKIQIEFRPHYENKFCHTYEVKVLLQLSSVVLKDGVTIENEIFRTIKKMREDYITDITLKRQADEQKQELEQLKKLQEKYKSVDLA